MRFIIVSVCPVDSGARYMLAGYQLKAYLDFHKVADVEVLNFPGVIESENLVARIREAQPTLLGFSIYTWNVELLKKTAPLLRQELNDVQIVCGGPEVSALTMTTMAEAGLGDFFIEGEGETALNNLLLHLISDGGKSRKVPGVFVWKNRQLEESTPQIADCLNTTPSPYLSGVIPRRLMERQQVFIETQRGCHNRCSYCLYHRGRPSISYFPIEQIIEEIRLLVVDYQVTALRIIDAMFTSDLSRAKAILRFIVELKKDHEIPLCYWEFMIHNVDEEFLSLAAQMRDTGEICNHETLQAKDHPQHYSQMLQGYKAINCFGIQSFNISSLKAIQRTRVSRPGFLSFMETVRKYNLLLKIDLILGLPEESKESFLAGVDFLLPHLRHTDHILNIHRLQMLPGTLLAEQKELYKIRTVGNSHLVRSTSTMSAGEINWLSTMCGLLFRIINSPLRENWFEAIDRGEHSNSELLQRLLSSLPNNPATKSSRLVTDASVDDIYWNNNVFREIPSSWLSSTLAAL